MIRHALAAAVLLAAAGPALAQPAPAAVPAPPAPPRAMPQPTIPDDPALAAIVRDRLAWLAGGGNGVTDVDRLQPQETVTGGRGGPLPTLDPEARTISTPALADALKIARDTRSMSLIVMRNGKVELEWYAPGYSEASRSSPASMMKPVMAMVMGAVIARGDIGSVDDPIGRYITEWKDDPRGAITIRQVLQMNTGLAFDGAGSPRGADLSLGVDMTSVVLGAKMGTEAEKGFQYNNVVSQLGGLIIERATGKRYAEVLSQTLWRPIGARDAGVWLDRPGGSARTFCCLLATARDWARVGELIRNDGKVGRRQVLPAAWLAEMTAPSPGYANFGFQMWRASPYDANRTYGPKIALKVPAKEPFLAPDMVYFDGAGGQRVYVSKATGLTIIRIGTGLGPWEDSGLPNAVVRGLR